MSVGGLVLALGSDKADNDIVAARLPLGKRLLSVPDGLPEDAGEHDSFEAHLPHSLNDVNKSITDFEGRRSVHKDHRVKATKRHNRPPVPHSATTDAGPEFLNKSLQKRPILERNNKCESSFIPVVFDGMLDRNTPIPTYRLPAGFTSPVTRRTGPALTAPRAGPTFSEPMEN